jgi:hypothetical protein
MREIDYDKLLANVKEMINTLEFDSMRSGGKCKINAQTMHYMLELEKHYQSKVNSNKQPSKKEA